MARKERTRDAVSILHGRYVKGKPEREAAVEAERVNAEVARLIYDLRVDAGLSQQALADLIGTTQSVISRLEDADYEGHSLSMLTRIAEALKQKLTVAMTARDPEAGGFRRAFHAFVKMLRRSRGLSVAELARRADIDPAEVAAMEQNCGYRPSPLVLHKLGKFYGIPERRLAEIAGAVRDVPGGIREKAARFAAQSDSFAKLTPEEQRLLDEFVKFLKAEAQGS
jgi:transcriptional regulator with XRE-family HTH domain